MDEHAHRAKVWMAAISDVLVETVPAPFTFALVLYLPDSPKGALMLSPEVPSDVGPVLAMLAATISDGTATLVMRPDLDA